MRPILPILLLKAIDSMIRPATQTFSMRTALALNNFLATSWSFMLRKSWTWKLANSAENHLLLR